MSYVLGRKPKFDESWLFPGDLILSYQDTEKPLLFDTRDEAIAFFNEKSPDKSMAEANAFVREATEEEVARGIHAAHLAPGEKV